MLQRKHVILGAIILVARPVLLRFFTVVAHRVSVFVMLNRVVHVHGVLCTHLAKFNGLIVSDIGVINGLECVFSDLKVAVAHASVVDKDLTAWKWLRPSLDQAGDHRIMNSRVVLVVDAISLTIVITHPIT